MKTAFKILGLLVLLGLYGATMPVKNACAADGGETDPNLSTDAGNGTIAPQTCDSKVWTHMSARARLETEREVMLNQTLIFKPDSILNYVCFDKFAGHATQFVGVLFTHTTYFEGKEIISSSGANSMDNAMQTVVGQSLSPYLSSNFSHKYLGGRSTSTPPSPSVTKGTYACGEMSKVWAEAKCRNFMHDSTSATSDGFYPFKNLKGMGSNGAVGYESVKETRNYPTPCNSGQFIDGDWKDKYEESRNERNGVYDRDYQYGTPNNDAFTKVREKVDPGKCGAAVKTGITILRGPGESQTGQDGVCTNPGCTLTSSGTCQ